MSTDLFTVSPDDPVTFAASLMDWRHIRNVPVEDESGRLAGLVSSRDCTPAHLQRRLGTTGRGGPVPIREIMNLNPVSIPPETLLSDLARKMIDHHVDCLPVTRQRQLVGLVTSHDLLVAHRRSLRCVARIHAPPAPLRILRLEKLPSGKGRLALKDARDPRDID